MNLFATSSVAKVSKKKTYLHGNVFLLGKCAVHAYSVLSVESTYYCPLLYRGIAGGSSIIIVNPTDVVKTQMQTATGQPQIMKIARNVWKGEGIAGFWKGVNPNVARCFIGNACEIGFYDTTKQNLLANDIVDDGPLAHFSASAVSCSIQSSGVPVTRLTCRVCVRLHIGCRDPKRHILHTGGRGENSPYEPGWRPH